jgi:ketosteroid isomerase-like protein
MEASRTADFETLRSLMTDDAVILPPGGKPVRGKVELDASFGRMGGRMGQVEVLEYFLDFKEVKILGDYAFEWGEIRGSMRQTGGEPQRSSYNVMRIQQIQPDGEWKVHRSIWNERPTNDPNEPLA